MIQKEALENCNDGRWSPYICVLALSSVVKRAVSFHYSDHGDVRYKKMFNRTILPRPHSGCVSDVIDKINILNYCESKATDAKSCQPNHYVPVIFLTISDISANDILKTKKNTKSWCCW